MESAFNCPPEFDIKTSRIYMISKDFKPEYIKAPLAGLSIVPLGDWRRPGYLSTQRKVWKLMHWTDRLVFEEVFHPPGGRNYVQHYHTEFPFHNHRFHIDYVYAWSFGPGTGQRNVKVYVDGELRCSAITGGNSFGMNWGRGWPAKIFVDDVLVIFEPEFHSHKPQLTWEYGDENFPVSMYEPTWVDDIPFDLFDFTSDSFVDQLLSSVDLNDINHLFSSTADEAKKLDFIEGVFRKLRGHYLSDSALLDVMRGAVWHDFLWLGDHILGDGGDKTDIARSESDANALTSYLRSLSLKPAR